MGLTLVKAENADVTCTNGKGSCIDYALVTSSFVEAIVGMKAVKAVPWGPHYRLRIRFRTDIKNMTTPEIVRPKPIEEAVKELEKLGLTEPNSEGIPRISWEEAVKITRGMVAAARKRKQPEVQEYAEAIGITDSMERATWQYAEWFAAAEIRLLSAKGVKVKWMTNTQMAKFCGRGLPWEVRQRPVCESKKQDYIEEQAWHVTAGDVCGRPVGHDCRNTGADEAEEKHGPQTGGSRQRILKEDIRGERRERKHGRNYAKSCSPKRKRRKRQEEAGEAEEKE